MLPTCGGGGGGGVVGVGVGVCGGGFAALVLQEDDFVFRLTFKLCRTDSQYDISKIGLWFFSSAIGGMHGYAIARRIATP